MYQLSWPNGEDGRRTLWAVVVRHLPVAIQSDTDLAPLLGLEFIPV
jgi:hypothetical protein